MKKETNGGSNKNPRPKILGATPLQIGEHDAGRLVGGIVEKGFSDITPTGPLGPSSAPRPTVLPFPVARHRSHGPHWGPKVGNFNVVNDSDDVDDGVGEEEDFDGMEMASGVAKPVERKEKKGLDFRRWKEIVKNGDNFELHEKKKGIGSTGLESGRKVKEIHSANLSRQIADPDDFKLSGTSHVDPAKEQFMTMDDKVFTVKEVKAGTEGVKPQNDMAKSNERTIMENVPTWETGLDKEIRDDSKMQSMQKTKMASGFAAQKLGGGEKESLESQIDAENRARLANMSADEIAEAQSEIMAKLNPELINALKKRSQSKVKRQKVSLSDVNDGKADGVQQEKNLLSNLTTSSGNTITEKPVKLVPGDALQDKDDKASSNISPENRSMWDAWSTRVEHARDMRFSLDGNIIGSELANVSDTGKAPSESGYNADNVSERDFLRTEGDPGAAGYTIKEAVTLTRSVVPGQRALAIHLITAVLDRAICGICQKQVDSSSNIGSAIDWEAIWAFALGPEPELALSLRMSLDDNHNSVVLACAKAIQSVLSCDVNDTVFDILEKTPTYARDVCTAPVFRSKPDVNVGFLRGGFWKYNTKPSNILCLDEDLDADKEDNEHTIQDDVVVAGQDFAAGLVRMGILPRICYLLETDPSAPLEECLISILIAIARHSPTGATAIVDCGRLVQTIANQFASKEQMEINSCKIKSVALLKVLARLEKKNCLKFRNEGILQKVTWHLYRYPFSLDQWVKSGREACKLSSALLVEQLRLWKVFICYGYCISEFSNLFTSLCIWLSVPTFEKLIDNNLMNEYCAVTREVYLLLDVLAGKLPNFYSRVSERMDDADQDNETCSWNQFGSIIDLALEWIQVKSIPHVSRLFNCQNKDDENHSMRDSEVNSLLWVISSVLNMLSSVLRAVIPDDITSLPNGHLPWLPEFVPKLGLEIIKNGYLRSSGVSDANGSIVEYLCFLKTKNRPELAISSTCCLQGLIQVIKSVDKLIQNANLEIHNAPSKYDSLSVEDKVLANGIFKSCVDEVRYLLTNLMKVITDEWQCMRPVEIFSRGGPAPGVGVGWGAYNGGYWSLNNLLAQQDARLLVYLLEISDIPSTKDPSEAMQMLNCALTACLVVGPGNSPVIDKLLKFIYRVPVLKHLDLGIRNFICLRKGCRSFTWNYEEEEFQLFSNALATHFRNRWLSIKRKKEKSVDEKNRASHKSTKKESRLLETIYEDNIDAPNAAGEELSSLRVEWAHQRLPLPAHWFLSAISTVHSEKPPNFLEVAKGGLFFLLGIEAIPTFLSSEWSSSVTGVPVVWKLHAMSVILLSGMEILEDEKSRDVYETLQNVYGEILDEWKLALQFGSGIHENYSTFIENLVEQFAAESYGDVLFGRQVAMYLQRSVEASIRLAAWNALSNARALELLPSVDKCFTKAEVFLEPLEDDERILEAYVKSWVSGALDKAANRSSVTFSLVLHHLSSFIFGNVSGDTLSLRNKLAKSLMRDYARKHQHEGLMVKLICYKKPNTSDTDLSLDILEIEKRLLLLKEICDGNVMEVQKLESCVRRELNARTSL